MGTQFKQSCLNFITSWYLSFLPRVVFRDPLQNCPKRQAARHKWQYVSSKASKTKWIDIAIFFDSDPSSLLSTRVLLWVVAVARKIRRKAPQRYTLRIIEPSMAWRHFEDLKKTLLHHTGSFKLTRNNWRVRTRSNWAVALKDLGRTIGNWCVIETIHSQVSHKQKNTQLATFNEVQYSTPIVLW